MDYDPIPTDDADSTRGIYTQFIKSQELPKEAPKPKVEAPKPVKREAVRMKTGVSIADAEDINADHENSEGYQDFAAYAEFTAKNSIVGLPNAEEELKNIKSEHLPEVLTVPVAQKPKEEKAPEQEKVDPKEL